MWGADNDTSMHFWLREISRLMLLYYLVIFYETCMAVIFPVAKNDRECLRSRPEMHSFAVCSIFHLFTQATGARSYAYIWYINFFRCLGLTAICHCQICFGNNSFLSTLASVETYFIPSYLSLELTIFWETRDQPLPGSLLCAERGTWNEIAIFPPFR